MILVVKTTRTGDATESQFPVIWRLDKGVDMVQLNIVGQGIRGGTIITNTEIITRRDYHHRNGIRRYLSESPIDPAVV